MFTVIKEEKAKEILIEIDAHLASVETRGDSVEHLYMARIGLMRILKALEIVDPNKELPKEENKPKEG